MSKGIPKSGDRSAWDVNNYGSVHASDIANETWEYHRNPADPGGGSVVFYDEGILGGTASILNVTGDGGAVSVAGGTATLNITGGSVTTRWEPLANGDGGTPALVFLDGDVIMVEVEI